MTRYIGIDTETHQFGTGNQAPKVVSLAWATADNQGPMEGVVTDHGEFRWVSTWGEIGESGQPTKTSLAQSRISDRFLEMIDDPNVHLVGHNLSYDMMCLAASCPELLDPILTLYRENRVHCTWILEKLRAIELDLLDFDPDIGKPPRFSLAETVWKIFNHELPKEDTWRLRYAELDGVPIDQWPEAAVNYAVNDALWAYNVYMNRARTQVYPDEWLQVRTDLAFQAMHCWGQEFRQSKVIALEKELEAKIHSEIDPELGVPLEEYLITQDVVRPTGEVNTRQVKRRIWAHFTGLKYPDEYDIRWVEKRRKKDPDTKEWMEPFYIEPIEPTDIPPETLDILRKVTEELVPRTKLDGISYNKDTLLLTDDTVLHKLQKRNSTQKGLNDFIPKLRPLVHPRFNTLVATGRSSCSAPNTQQMPRSGDFRGCMVPRPGWKLVWVDYSAIELCTLAESHYEEIGRSALGDLLKQGIDPHLWMAVEILKLSNPPLDISYEEAKGARKNPEHPHHQAVKDARQMAKAANFGFPGGMGPAKFTIYARGSWGVDISLEKSRWLKDLWLRTFPEMVDHFAIVGALGDNHAYALPKSGRVRGGLGFCDGCNTRFQGPAADLNKDAFWEVFVATRMNRNWMPTVYASPLEIPGWMNLLSGSRQVNFVHDEQVIEVPGSWELMGVPLEHQPLVSAPEAILDVVEQTMVRVGQRWLKHVPVLVEGTIGDCWGK